jgi:hypothetical protein
VRLRISVVVVIAVSICLSGCGAASHTVRATNAAAITQMPRGTHRCHTSLLRIRTFRSFAGLNHSGAYIAFTNRGRTACELKGWPKLVAITAAGRASKAVDYPAYSFEVTRTGIGIPVVKLSPGMRADAEFKAVDGAAKKCPPSYRWLRITPPGNTKSVVRSAWVRYLDAYLPACHGVALSRVLPASDLMGG